MPTHTLTSGSVGPERRWGWLLSTDGSQIGYHDGPFDPDPDTDALTARLWADDLTGATRSWTPGTWSAHGPRSYTTEA
ncbi:hypothetical protein ACIRVF_08215 [Kitasatospora sp. NPDC101157]|uniref:hypothetical protein n=1 Tax=Kitasatospora sp. NPDC101157 TaxID=3364098 RepID=UPI0038089CB9